MHWFAEKINRLVGSGAFQVLGETYVWGARDPRWLRLGTHTGPGLTQVLTLSPPGAKAEASPPRWVSGLILNSESHQS